jgi:hypothetical protein
MSAPTSTWSAGTVEGETIFHSSFSRATVTAPLALCSSTRASLSRSTSTSTLLRSTPTFFGTCFQTSSGTSRTLDSSGRMA